MCIGGLEELIVKCLELLSQIARFSHRLEILPNHVIRSSRAATPLDI